MHFRRLHRYRYKLVAVAVIFLILMYHNLRSHEDNSSTEKYSNHPLKAGENTTKLIKTFLLVLILTGPSNKQRRDVIRETWLAGSMNGRQHEVLHYFVVGTKNLGKSDLDYIERENRKNDDMLLLEDFVDAYEKLTEKVGLSLKWVNKHIDFKYVFKGDDDTYARLDVIENDLRARNRAKPDESLYYGYFYGRSHVKKAGPWKETEWKLCDYYLPYARGGGYILSSSVVSYIANNFNIFKQYLSEDVSMGSWLAPLEVERVHDIRFDTEYKTRGCSNTFVVCHKQSTDDMMSKHESLAKTGKLCEKESSLFHGYDYNWDVPPSQCCVRMSNIP